VIGHEIGHGFDDQGRKSDGDGVLRDWWTAEDAAKFKIQKAKLGAQYSAFEPFPGVHVNGDLTMGENIGDMGGLGFGLDAYHVSLKGKPAPVMDGFTGDQRVYLGWAQVWRQKSRDDALKQQIASDPHSPALLPRQRHHPQPAGLVRRVRHQAGRQAVRRPGGSREDLVVR
jgi:putative endopeptidase